MNAQDLLQEILASGQKIIEKGGQLAEQGRSVAENSLDFAKQKFSLPEAGPERDQMLRNLGAGAAAGGILAMLLATRRGRSTLKTGAKLGSLAALGALGYKIYADHQRLQGNQIAEPAVGHLTDQSETPRCLMIVRAMIAAAKADGVIDENERKMIENRIRDSNLDVSAMDALLEEIQKPLDPKDLALMAKEPIDAIDIYLASLLVVEDANESEQHYLKQLASELDLDQGLVKRIESEAFRPV